MTLQIIGHFFLAAATAYCCGNLNGAILTSHFQYNSDVREHGSGNAGLTNFYRIYGAAKMVSVFLIDVAKAVVAVLVGGILLNDFALQEEGRCVALLFVILGHIFPASYDFRGGKGVLSACAAMFVIDWRVVIPMAVIFFAVLLISRYVSLSSICTLAVVPVVYWLLHRDIVCSILLLLSVAVVIFMHRANISRLLKGTESKLELPRKKN